MSDLREIFSSMLDKKHVTLRKKDLDTMLPIERREFIEEEASTFYNNRIKTMEKNYELFNLFNTVPYPVTANKLEKDQMVPGALYNLSYKRITEFLSRAAGHEIFDYQLFLNIVRDGSRLTIPIYKLFYMTRDQLLRVNVINSDTPLYISLEEGDQFLITLGSNLRSTLREIKRQANFIKRVKLELAGAIAKFDEEQL